MICVSSKFSVFRLSKKKSNTHLGDLCIHFGDEWAFGQMSRKTWIERVMVNGDGVQVAGYVRCSGLRCYVPGGRLEVSHFGLGLQKSSEKPSLYSLLHCTYYYAISRGGACIMYVSCIVAC